MWRVVIVFTKVKNMNAMLVVFIFAFLDDVVPLMCQCPDNIQPVCAEDRLTYKNSCAAKCKNVAVVSEGSCDFVKDFETRRKRNFCEDTCYSRLAAVCAKSGQTYKNICVLECSGDEFAHVGSCKHY